MSFFCCCASAHMCSAPLPRFVAHIQFIHFMVYKGRLSGRVGVGKTKRGFFIVKKGGGGGGGGGTSSKKTVSTHTTHARTQSRRGRRRVGERRRSVRVGGPRARCGANSGGRGRVPAPGKKKVGERKKKKGVKSDLARCVCACAHVRVPPSSAPGARQGWQARVCARARATQRVVKGGQENWGRDGGLKWNTGVEGVWRALGQRPHTPPLPPRRYDWNSWELKGDG